MRANKFRVSRLLVKAVLVSAGSSAIVGVAAAEDSAPGRFRECKTFFQTNTAYDPRLAIATDAVVVHRHGEELEPLRRSIGSWKEKGFVVGRMFFADSDATNAYWKGQWDGTPHEDEVERDANGNVVLCAGVRPYMLPTEGWMRHLEEMTRVSIEAGADAVLPEEPLAHTFTGYEGAFKPMFEKRFGIPWQPERASAEAHFLTCQLKTELYLELEQRLARVTKAEAARLGRPIDFLLPVHPLYSNRASRLVAPMGMALGMKELDGYVGQVWTGPVNWCVANYSSPDKSFFTSAYALYDYFAALTAGTQKKMWLLADPVEDDPNHEWSEFEQWYRHCLAAKLMFPGIDAYEVMPWPDRVFLPGYQTGGGTPAPEPYRVSLLSAIQVLQEIPALPPDPQKDRIAVAIGDTALWEAPQSPMLDNLYGLILPLIHQGLRPTVSLAERWTEPGYLDRFRVIVLSFENFKPAAPDQNLALVAWVKAGGVLVIVGGGGELKGEPFWWTQSKHSSPLDHLLASATLGRAGDLDTALGKGRLIRRTAMPPKHFAHNPGDYLGLVRMAAEHAGLTLSPDRAGLSVVRGPFRVLHALGEAATVPGPLVDVFDPELPVHASLTLLAGQSGIYRQVADIYKGQTPAVLHCTHRLIEQRHEGDTSRITLRGPAGTPAVVRLFTAGRHPSRLTVRSGRGDVPVRVRPDEAGRTLQIRFDNVPEGAAVEINWAGE